MELSTRNAAILFLDRNRFDFYVEAQQAILSFPFQDTIINTMDVLNPAELENQIKAFVEQNHIGPANVMMILSSNVIFERDLTTIENQAIEKFQDTVPFENIYTQSFPLPQGIRVITVNRDLCDAIKSPFEKLGFNIDAIVSYAALGPELNNITGLDPQISQQIIKKSDSLRHYGFPIEKKADIVSQATPKGPPQGGKPNIKLYIMIGVFLFLLSILLLLIFRG